MNNTSTRLPTLYEIVNHLRRHQAHIEHLKAETESLFAQEPENGTLHGMIGYLEDRKSMLEESRLRLESMQDYPNAVEQGKPTEAIGNAIQEALAANGNGQ